MSSYEFKCSKCSKSTKFTLNWNEFGRPVEVGCSYCTNRTFLWESKCTACGSLSCAHRSCKSEFAESKTYTCPTCFKVVERTKSISVSDKDLKKKVPKVCTGLNFIKSLYTKSYPKLMWAPGVKCKNCEADTIFFEFTKDTVKKHCSLCGEQEWKP